MGVSLHAESKQQNKVYVKKGNTGPKVWVKKGNTGPKKVKTVLLAGKLTATVFWDAEGILLV